MCLKTYHKVISNDVGNRNIHHLQLHNIVWVSHYCVYKGKGKTVLLQVWSGPEGSRKLRLPDFMMSQDGGKVVSLTHRPPLPPGNAPGTHIC